MSNSVSQLYIVEVSIAKHIVNIERKFICSSCPVYISMIFHNAREGNKSENNILPMPPSLLHISTTSLEEITSNPGSLEIFDKVSFHGFFSIGNSSFKKKIEMPHRNKEVSIGPARSR